MKILGVYPSSKRRKHEVIIDIKCEKCGHLDTAISSNLKDAEEYLPKVKCKKCKM